MAVRPNPEGCPGCAAEAAARAAVLASPEAWRLLMRERIDEAVRLDQEESTVAEEPLDFLYMLDFEDHKAFLRRAKGALDELDDESAFLRFIEAERDVAQVTYSAWLATRRLI